MLRFGSVGDAVRRLQRALNLDPTGAPLAPDGQFGMLTHGRVVRFQAAEGTTPDGIVGPLTTLLLKRLYDLLDHSENRPGSSAEDRLRARIASIATNYCNAFGWNENRMPPERSRILQRYMLDSTTRLRWGGVSLLVILNRGGAPGQYTNRAIRIPPNMAIGELFTSEAQKTQDPTADTKAYAARRNGEDILSWCGIFATMVLREAGLPIKGWVEGNGLTNQAAPLFSKPDDPAHANKPLRNVSQKEFGVGDIGVVDPASRNHHFVVVRRNGAQLETIDGNAGFFHSIVRKTYTLDKPNNPHPGGVHKVSGRQVQLLSAFPMANRPPS